MIYINRFLLHNNVFAVVYSASKQPDVLPRSAVSFESTSYKDHSDNT